MTGIPYGLSGVMFGLREDHDVEEYGDCLCSPLPLGWGWQRGCPTTGLAAAPVWRPRSVQVSAAADAVERLRRSVAGIGWDHQATGAQRVVGESARAEQLARWHADDQTAAENAPDHGAVALTADGGAP